MDKTMLLMMLAQQAPRLLSLLQNRGYDPGLMQDSINSHALFSEENPSSIAATAFNPAQLAELDYSHDINSINTTPDSLGWLDFGTMNDMDIRATAGQMLDHQGAVDGPAMTSALSMLAEKPYIGTEYDPALYSESLNEEPQYENWHNDALNNLSDIIKRNKKKK